MNTVKPGEGVFLSLATCRCTLVDLRGHVWSVCGWRRLTEADRCGGMVGVGVEAGLAGIFPGEQAKGLGPGWGEQRTRDRLRYGVREDDGACHRSIRALYGFCIQGSGRVDELSHLSQENQGTAKQRARLISLPAPRIYYATSLSVTFTMNWGLIESLLPGY